jgi:hypothetical protein
MDNVQNCDSYINKQGMGQTTKPARIWEKSRQIYSF